VSQELNKKLYRVKKTNAYISNTWGIAYGDTVSSTQKAMTRGQKIRDT